jgi:hypothetical protein
MQQAGAEPLFEGGDPFADGRFRNRERGRGRREGLRFDDTGEHRHRYEIVE